jgi:hypothetical protein
MTILRLKGSRAFERREKLPTDPPYYELMDIANSRTVVLRDDVVDWCLDMLGYRPHVFPLDVDENGCRYIAAHARFATEDDAMLFKLAFVG